MMECAAQHTDDLDYLQSLLSSLGSQASLNPSLDAVCDAFSRRRIAGRFRTQGYSVELDTLLNQSSKGAKDDDDQLWINASNTKRESNYQSSRPCFRFQ